MSPRAFKLYTVFRETCPSPRVIFDSEETKDDYDQRFFPFFFFNLWIV